MLSDQTLATAFNALAHPRRVRLYRLLIERPELGGCVKTLQEVTGFQKAALLHHLRVLEKAGLLARHRAGGSVSQKLKPGALATAMAEVQRLSVAAGPATRRAA